MRTLIKAAVAVLVLGGLLVGADRIALSVAEGQAADRLANKQGISGRPSVTIEGFPFLTQVIDKKFDDVRLSADSVNVSGAGQTVQLDAFSARLSGVQVNGGYTSATVDSGTGSGRLPYQEVEQLLGLGSQVTLGYGGPGELKVGYQLMGQTLSAMVKLRVNGNQVQVADVSGLSGVGALPGLGGMISSAVDSRSFALQGLPVGLALSQVTPEPDGLALSFQGSHVQLVGS
ncbi:DUF2993 domain-containing protein [Kitasatospora sp. NPDC052896]|uniref:DUF2993 domain-containing protein n=1 Tax=Kitasatospora sp. NPDC052896 TaxID=3364061 RepID=UPI0037C7C131